MADGFLLIFMSVALFLFFTHFCFVGASENASVIYVFLLWCFFLAVIYGLTADVGNYYVPVIGFFNVCGLIVFYSSVYFCTNDRLKAFYYIKYLFVLFSLVNAVGAIAQFFVSDDLFGLTSNSVYADTETLSNVNVERRAVSFISSPQSLSLFLAFGLVLAFDFVKSIFYKYLCVSLIMLAGLLTVSKAFFVFVIVYLVFYNLSWKRFSYLLAVVFLVFITFMYAPAEGKFSRILQLMLFFTNYEQYPAYIIWSESFLYVNDFYSFILGKGIGVFSRGGQVLADYRILYGSTESFFIQLYVEIGFVGLGLFLVMTMQAYFRLLTIDKSLACSLAAICSVGLFTPAPYGFVCGLLIHFCLVSGICLDVKPR